MRCNGDRMVGLVLGAILVACSPSAQPPPSPPVAKEPSTTPTATTATSASDPPPSSGPPAAADEPKGATPHADMKSGASVKHPPEDPPDPVPTDGSCPGAFNQIKDSKVGEHKCKCKTGVPSGSVWGTTIYTSDSNVCKAAIHVGAIKSDKGGEVTVKAAPGCSAYTSTTANGVTTTAYAQWEGSFYFPGHGDGKCAPGTAINPGVCPANLIGAKLGADGQLKCDCGANPTGSVYGTMVYTADSSLCAAALHAGAIPKTGGKVTVKSLSGCSKYEASTKNGVTSAAWASYGSSYFFPGFGPGKCP